LVIGDIDILHLAVNPFIVLSSNEERE